MKPLFEKPRVSVDKEPTTTLLEALLLCEQDALADALCKLVSLQENVSSTKGMRKQICAHVQEVMFGIEQLRSLADNAHVNSDANANANASGTVLVVPREVFYLRPSGEIARFIKGQGVTLTLFDMKTYTPADVVKSPSNQLCIMPYSAVSIALLPWVYALSARVCFSGALCRAERYEVLASAFWELTYFGCDEQSAREGQKREYARRIKQGVLTPLMVQDASIPCVDQIQRTEERFVRVKALDLDGASWQNRLYQAHVAQSVLKLNDAAHERFIAEIDALKSMC